jgi:hypothetical protein
LGKGKRRAGRKYQEVNLTISNGQGRNVCSKTPKKQQADSPRNCFIAFLLLSRNTFQQLSNVALATGYPEMALQLLSDSRYDAPIQI